MTYDGGFSDHIQKLEYSYRNSNKSQIRHKFSQESIQSRIHSVKNPFSQESIQSRIHSLKTPTIQESILITKMYIKNFGIRKLKTRL